MAVLPPPWTDRQQTRRPTGCLPARAPAASTARPAPPKGGRCTSKANATKIAQEAGEAASEWLGQAAARATSKYSNLSGIGLRGLDGLAAAAVGVKGGEAFGGEITAFAQRSIETGVDAATGALAAGSLTEAAAAQAAEAHFEAVAVEGARLQALGLTFATESIRVCNAHAKAVFEDAAK